MLRGVSIVGWGALHLVERVLHRRLVLERGQAGDLAQRAVVEGRLVDRLLLRQKGQVPRIHHPSDAARAGNAVVANTATARRRHPERL